MVQRLQPRARDADEPRRGRRQRPRRTAGDISRQPVTPRAPLWLGAGGALAFIAGAAAVAVGPDWLRATAYVHLTHFAALALVFPGAALWGFAASAGARGEWYAAGALPLLLGWASLAAIHPLLRTLLLVAGFAIAFAVDSRAVRAGLAPPWYFGLRKTLTAVALAALGVVALAAN